MQEAFFLALALGVVATYTTKVVRKWFPSVDGQAVQLVVLAVCFVMALVVTLAKQLLPAEALATLMTSFTTAIAWYELAVRNRDNQ
jgi:predicted PurR-regulated permease PerM